MKAIRVRYIGQTDRMPARWKAEDGDGNTAFVPASSCTGADAVELLCNNMNWAGALISGGFKNEEFWVWDDESSPRITVGGEDALTGDFALVLKDLRAVAPMVADAVARHWEKGEHYYIDERVTLPKHLRARFDAINDALLAEEDARFTKSQALRAEDLPPVSKGCAVCRRVTLHTRVPAHDQKARAEGYVTEVCTEHKEKGGAR